MKIIDQTIAKIKKNPNSGTSDFLASALASACNSHHKINLLDASVALDKEGKALLMKLMCITDFEDYSNKSQGNALVWLADNDYI